MSNKALTVVFEHSKAKGAAFCIMLALADWANDNNCAWPAIETLAMKARVSIRTVQTEIVNLEKSGELRVDRGSGPCGVNRYFVTLKTGTQSAAAPRWARVQSATETPTVGVKSTASQSRPNHHEPKRHKENLKTKPVAARKLAAGGGGKRELRYWGDSCPVFQNDPVRIDRAGSPRPPKQPPPMSDPLMQARNKPAAAAGGGPLFGEPEPVREKTDEIVVREVFQLAYERKHGVKAKWTGAEAKHAKDLMRAVRQGAEKRKANPEMVLARVVTAFLNDEDAFLSKNGYRFLLLSQRSPRYISEVLKLGSANAGPQIRTGSW